jgi:hypothetical protein
MTQGFQRFTTRYASLIGVLIGLTVVSSILFYSGCGMTSSPSIPTNPTPTPTPTPDNVRPTSTITSPTEGANVLIGTPVAITGTASDAGGGSVVRVEVSVNGGATYSAAMGTNAWSFNWTPSALGPVTIKSRAVDNAGNVQDPPAEIHVTVDAPPTSTITSPTVGATVFLQTAVNITGTAIDAGGGTVARVEVSVDGGATWNMATGTRDWSFNWTPSALGPATLKSRAIDNSGNVQDPPAEVTVTVVVRDGIPPTVTPLFPDPGRTDVGIFVGVRAFFSEEMDPATVNESTVELLDPSGAPVPATVTYFASSRDVVLDPTEPLSPGTTYTALVKGGDTDPRVKDVAGNALAADRTWSFTTGVSPQVLSNTPMDGAVNVPTGVAPRAKFSKELSFLRLTSPGAVLLQDSAGNQIPFTVLPTFGVIPSTVIIVPRRLLEPLQTYTVTFKGGLEEPHVTDNQFTPLESDYTWSFTTAAEPPPMAIFAPDDRPIPIDPDPEAVEVGLKFRSDSAGLITGIRFHKRSPANGGEHVGHLWTGTGTLLGSVTFNTETERGWQQALFQTPIPIEANTTYVVSYFAPQGNYSATPGQFASAGIDTPPLHALQDGVDGGNGVFLNSPTGGFPTQTINSTNYWVDVVFGDPTLAPPQVLSTTPAPGMLLIVPIQGQAAPLSVTFSEPLDPMSVNDSTVTLIDTAGNPVPIAFSFGAGNFTVTITPLQPLQSVAGYTVTLKGGGSAPHITDVTGTPLASDFTWSITTNSFLGLAFTEETMINNWVTAGGNFIAMRPRK